MRNLASRRSEYRPGAKKGRIDRHEEASSHLSVHDRNRPGACRGKPGARPIARLAAAVRAGAGGLRAGQSMRRQEESLRGREVLQPVCGKESMCHQDPMRRGQPLCGVKSLRGRQSLQPVQSLCRRRKSGLQQRMRRAPAGQRLQSLRGKEEPLRRQGILQPVCGKESLLGEKPVRLGQGVQSLCSEEPVRSDPGLQSVRRVKSVRRGESLQPLWCRRGCRTLRC